MTTTETILIAIAFLLIGYLMGKCGGRVVSQYPKSFVEKLKPKQVYENDPYQDAMGDYPQNEGTIEDET